MPQGGEEFYVELKKSDGSRVPLRSSGLQEVAERAELDVGQTVMVDADSGKEPKIVKGVASDEENSIRQAARPAAQAVPNEVDAIRPARLTPSGADAGEEARPPDRASATPATLLNGRFVRDNKGEYRRVGEERVALADDGQRIRFVDKQMDAFEAGVELAKAKGWTAIEVAGTEQFKEQAWFHARMAGLEVMGFEPNAGALARLDQAQKERGLARSAEATLRADPQRCEPALAAAKEDRKAAEIAATPLQEPHVAVEAMIASRQEAQNFAFSLDRNVRMTHDERSYAGPLLHETAHHVVQDIGRHEAVIHEKGKLTGADYAALVGTPTSVRVNCQQGRICVDVPSRTAREHGR